jgi:hypothetical protein
MPSQVDQEVVAVESKFFTALAWYLAKEINSLAFLNAATCGEDEGMPLWVPTWM